MRKINLLTILVALVILVASASTTPAVAKGKAKDYIANFEAGKSLSKADIGFLNGISGGKADAKDATVGGAKYTVGQKLTDKDASALNKAKADYRKAHKMEKATDAKAVDKSRGNENCYWYLYCDGYGNCYYVWYCD